MNSAARTAAAGAVAVLVAVTSGPSVARAGEGPDTVAAKRGGAVAQSYPLVLMAQIDAVVLAEPEGPGAAAGNDPPADSLLRLRRLRVGEDVTRGDWRVRAVLEVNHRATFYTPVEGDRLPWGRPVRLTEAFVTWAPHRAYQLTAGAQRVPFTLSRQIDETDLRLPERPQIFAALAPDYRVGVAFTSDLGLLNLRIAGMSADTTLDGELLSSGYFGAVRLSADPIGPMGVTPWRMPVNDPWYGWWRFSAGVSVLYGTLLAPRTLGLGGDAQLQWKRLTVTGEYLGEYLTSGAGGWPHQGAVFEPGVFLLSQRLELVLRGAWYRRPYDISADPGDHTDTLAAGGGLTFFAHSAQVRLQAALETRRTRRGLLDDSNWAIFRVTLAL